MPQFRITDSVSGKTVTVSGDSAPTDEEAQQIFSDAGLHTAGTAPAPTAEVAPQRAPSPTTRNVMTEGAATAPKITSRPWSETPGEIRALAHGMATGMPAATFGMPGDIETIGRTLASSAGAPVSTESFLPTTERMANYIGGPSVSTTEDIGRGMGEFVGPSAAVSALRHGGRIAGTGAAHVLGLPTGTGARPIIEAARAGAGGGKKALTFLTNLRNPSANVDGVLQMARDAVDELYKTKNSQYLQGIKSSIGGQLKPLDFTAVDRAVVEATKIGTFKEQSLSSGGARVASAIHKVVSDWSKLDPKEYHTAEGLDALKKKIGDLAHDGELKSDAGPHSVGKAVIDKVYDTIKETITAEYPDYAKTMKQYSEASEALRNIEGELSIGKRALTGASVRKLQSIMRRTAEKDYGIRADMIEQLDKSNAVGGNLLPALAGQAMSSVSPRGISALLASGVPYAAIARPSLIPPLVAGAAVSSPRAVGEAAYYAGKGLGLLPPTSKTLMLQPSLALRSGSGG